MQVIIICPYGARTGGPEALHQLCHALIKFGVHASIYYAIDSDLDFIKSIKKSELQHTAINLGERNNLHNEYDKYQIATVTDLKFTRETIFIFPETFLHWVDTFHQNISVIWWLSVDNAFRYLASNTLNINSLRHGNIFHAYQSNYAKRFLDSLGIFNQIKLSDYTNLPSIIPSKKNSIAINAGPKVIFNLDTIANTLQSNIETNIHLIAGIKRAEVYEILGNSFCFIDLGNFPGKDRLAREAALLNCIPIVLDVGGAQDYLLPDVLKININQIDSLPFIINSVMENYGYYVSLIQNFVTQVKSEETEFMKEVSVLAKRLNSSF